MNVTVAVALMAAAFPAGTPDVASIRISIHQGVDLGTALTSADAAIPAAGPATADFANVPDGDYTALAQAIDASGNPVGTAMQQTFTVATPPAPDVSRPVPASMTVEISSAPATA